MRRLIIGLAVAAFGLVSLVNTLPAMGSLVIGSCAIQRDGILDISPGQVYIYPGGAFDEGLQMGTLTFFGHGYSGDRYMTPILVDEIVDDVFTVRGVGTGRTVTASPMSQSFDFALQYGIDVTTGPGFTFGFINSLVDASGTRIVSSTGTVDHTLDLGVEPGNGVGGPDSTNRRVFTPGGDVRVALGTTFGVPGATVDFWLNDVALGTTNIDRTYSANMRGVPEPSTLVLLGMGVVGLLAYAWRKHRR